ncbi:MAG: dTDP-4-amino-4,6-dideoxyglucose formyltransferase [Halanaerobiales bacterium]|nr:dTDP-4-amino-4,6-dideoxyglucose formyltransferase [Halanaerobiales bacterium]
MNILILTDNEYLYKEFQTLISSNNYSAYNFDFYYSYNNINFNVQNNCEIKPINLKREYIEIINNYNLVFSLHCKQIFPSELVDRVRCINIHPGLNPYNRGWFPQVFSIINKLPLGVTIHEMDKELDHGPIIIQKEIGIYSWETSYDVYQRIRDLEIKLIKNNLIKLLNNDYRTFRPGFEGNINLKKDFNKLCKIDLEKKVSFKDAIDYFRAMTFKGYRNSYFFDEDGRKIFIEIRLEREEGEDDQ